MGSIGKMNTTFLQLVFVAVLNASGQLSLKMGAGAMESLSGLIRNPFLVFNHPYFILGAVLYGSSFALYVNALSRTRLSIAYPFIGLTYVIVVVLSATVLNEPVGTKTVLGVLLVFAGVSLIGLGGNVA